MRLRNPIRQFKSFLDTATVENAFYLDGAVPLSRALPLGLQHMLSMFMSNVTPALICMAIIGLDSPLALSVIQSSIFMAALGTAIQCFPILRLGGKLPLVMGTSFTFMGAVTMIGSSYGLSTAFISLIIGGVIIGFLGLFAAKWHRFIRPIVSSMVVIGLGLSLLSVGINDFFAIDAPGVVVDGQYAIQNAWPYLIVATITLLSSFFWQVFVKGMWRNISVLVGLVVGYLTALCFMGYNQMVDFSVFSFNSIRDVIDLPRPFFLFIDVSIGDINFGAILAIVIMYLVSTTECIGAVESLTAGSFDRAPTPREISGAVTAYGFVSAFAGLFGAQPLTGYSQNVGIVNQTKVVNRFVVFQTAVILFAASLFPPVARFFQTIPQPVLGGTMILLFASIVISGVQMFARAGFTRKNIMIASFAIGIGYTATLVPALQNIQTEIVWIQYLLLLIRNPMVNMFLISFVLSYAIPEEKEPALDDSSKPENKD